MKSEDKDPKSHVSWCWKQKHGIKLEDPNENLCTAYVRKAKSALNMLNAAIEKDEIDWIATTAYYSRYFALYALLQKCGIKSEIHDCTILLMHFLFVEENLIEEQYYHDLQLAKELRIDVQYYVTEQSDTKKLKTDTTTAPTFVLKMEEVIESITESQIEKIRQKISDAN